MPGPAEHQPRNPQVERLVLRQPEQRIPRSPHWRNSAPGDAGPLSRLADTAPRRVPPRPGRGVPLFSNFMCRTSSMGPLGPALGWRRRRRARTPPPTRACERPPSQDRAAPTRGSVVCLKGTARAPPPPSRRDRESLARALGRRKGRSPLACDGKNVHPATWVRGGASDPGRDRAEDPAERHFDAPARELPDDASPTTPERPPQWVAPTPKREIKGTRSRYKRPDRVIRISRASTRPWLPPSDAARRASDRRRST